MGQKSKPMKNFIIKIQNSDEATKKRWLIILSSASMVIVISLWVIISNLINGQIWTSESATGSSTPRTGFVADVISLVRRRTLNTFDYFGSKLGQPKEIVIDKEAGSFVPKGLNQIQPATLP